MNSLDKKLDKMYKLYLAPEKDHFALAIQHALLLKEFDTEDLVLFYSYLIEKRKELYGDE